MLGLLPAAAFAPRLLAQAPSPSLRLRTLNHFKLTVTDPKRSIEFYQTLFGMPVQAKSDGATLLRIGSGPQFMSIAPVAAGAAHDLVGNYVATFWVLTGLSILAAIAVLKADSARRP